MLNELMISPNTYQTTIPFPHFYQDNILDPLFAKQLQDEILNLSKERFDRYENPFEQKYTLRDKLNYPPLLKALFAYLESQTFIDKLSTIVGHRLLVDSNRHFNGVHTYDNGDKLDVHVDAGRHPETKLKKQVTLGIYLSQNWKDDYGCELEIWNGDSAHVSDLKIYNLEKKITPVFNRLIIFTNEDNSWHGNPEPAQCPQDAKRIFVTISYLSDNTSFENKRQKAYFVSRPDDPIDHEKDKLRVLRADPLQYKNVYRYSTKGTL